MSRSVSIFSGIGVKSIVKNAGYLLGTDGINKTVRFVYAIALAHFLGPELYGYLNYGISWYLVFLSLTGFGTAAILVREIARDRNNGPSIVSLTLTLRSSVTAFAAVACGILGWIFEGNPELRSLLIIFTFAMIGRSLVMWVESVFVAYEVTKYTLYLQVIFRTLEVIVGIAFLLAGGGAIDVATVHAISWWFHGLSGLILTRRYLVTIRFNPEWRGLKFILVKGLPIGLGYILLDWFQTGPLVLYRHMASTADSLGQLALAIQILAISTGIVMSAGVASLPVLSRSVARQDGKDLMFAELMIKVAFILGAGAGLGGIGAGPWIVNIIFGSKYAEAGYLLGIALWLLIPMTCGILITRVYLARGQFFLPTVCTGAGTVVFTLSMPWLVSAMDALGAVLAMGMGMVVWMLSMIWMLVKSDHLNLFRSVFRPMAVVLVALGIFLFLKSLNTWIALLTSWATLFCGTLVFGILTKDERGLITNLKRT